jgi:hypothetical protein
VRGQARLQPGKRRRRRLRALGAAREHRDGATVMGAGSQRVTDGQDDAVGSVLAAEQGSVRCSVWGPG